VSIRTIAEELNIPKSTAGDWAAELEPEIEKLRAIELEAIQERYLATYEREVALLGDEFNRVVTILRERDYGYVDTPALWNQLTVLLSRMDKKRVTGKLSKLNEPKPASPNPPPQT